MSTHTDVESTTMPTITIDGKRCSFEGRKMILQVAEENGITIPHFCYHPALSIVASCRMCLAEVAQPDPRNDNKLTLIPKLVPTCQTLAVDGAEVYLTTEKTIANQKQMLEFTLINHPLDCPVCDQAGECDLQDYTYDYGNTKSRFVDEKNTKPKKELGPDVLHYSDRCIMCTRCVRFTREVTGTNELGVFGRGAAEEIDVFPGKPLDNELSLNVVDICPVGAMIDSKFLFKQRVWFIRPTASIDGLTASGDNIYIHHDGRRVFRIKPRVNIDVNQWWVSNEVRDSWERVHSDERIDRPSVGSDVVDWPDAIESAVGGCKHATDTGKRLALMLSPMLSCEDAYLLTKFIKQLDPDAVLGLGPVPVIGNDKTFPSGYTIYAEKAPNARGVKRVVQHFFGNKHLHEYDSFITQLNYPNSNIGAVIITGNYPDTWPSDQYVDRFIVAITDRFTITIDTLKSQLTAMANVVLPSATWVEKAGSFENVNERIQAFERAILPFGSARAEGQIALDLAGVVKSGEGGVYAAEEVRGEMGGAFADLVLPISVSADVRVPGMRYVEL